MADAPVHGTNLDTSEATYVIDGVKYFRNMETELHIQRHRSWNELSKECPEQAVAQINHYLVQKSLEGEGPPLLRHIDLMIILSQAHFNLGNDDVAMDCARTARHLAYEVDMNTVQTRQKSWAGHIVDNAKEFPDILLRHLESEKEAHEAEAHSKGREAVEAQAPPEPVLMEEMESDEERVTEMEDEGVTHMKMLSKGMDELDVHEKKNKDGDGKSGPASVDEGPSRRDVGLVQVADDVRLPVGGRNASSGRLTG